MTNGTVTFYQIFYDFVYIFFFEINLDLNFILMKELMFSRVLFLLALYY